MRKFFLAVAVAIVGTLFSGSAANAGFSLRYSVNGGAFVQVDDEGAGDNDSGILGSISVSTFFSISVKSSATSFTNAQETFLDLSVSGTNNSGVPATTLNSLVVEATITGALTQPPPQSLHYDFGSGGLPSNRVTTAYQTWVDATDTAFGHGAVTTGAKSPNTSGDVGFNIPGSYSVTTQISLTRTGAGLISLSSDSNNHISTPAPAGLLLALTATPVFGLGAFFRRRRSA